MPTDTPTVTETKVAALREQLPTITRGGYFNSGFTGPLCRAAWEAIHAATDREFREGRMGPPARAATAAVLADARQRVATLIGADASDIALTQHTTAGITAVVQGVTWQAGDNVVTTQAEHKAGVLPLGVLRSRLGVEVRAVAPNSAVDPEALAQAMIAAIDRRTRLVVISHVLYVNGAIMPVDEVIAAAHRHGALVIVDGAQAAGVIPIDVKALDADAYALSGQKWLCGPEGTGALYVSPRALDRIAPTIVGWASVDTWQLDGHFVPNPDVSRFEIGTQYVPSMAGLAAAIGWMQDEVGLEWAGARSFALAEHLRDELRRRNVAVLTPPAHSGLVSFRGNRAPDEIVAALNAQQINIRSIFGYNCVRVSVGFFHTEQELDALLRLLIAIAVD